MDNTTVIASTMIREHVQLPNHTAFESLVVEAVKVDYAPPNSILSGVRS